jgi:hypothetical protein
VVGKVAQTCVKKVPAFYSLGGAAATPAAPT